MQAVGQIESHHVQPAATTVSAHPAAVAVPTAPSQGVGTSFHIGQRVYCRNKGEPTWRVGHVGNIGADQTPLILLEGTQAAGSPDGGHFDEIMPAPAPEMQPAVASYQPPQISSVMQSQVQATYTTAQHMVNPTVSATSAATHVQPAELRPEVQHAQHLLPQLVSYNPPQMVPQTMPVNAQVAVPAQTTMAPHSLIPGMPPTQPTLAAQTTMSAHSQFSAMAPPVPHYGHPSQTVLPTARSVPQAQSQYVKPQMPMHSASPTHTASPTHSAMPGMMPMHMMPQPQTAAGMPPQMHAGQMHSSLVQQPPPYYQPAPTPVASPPVHFQQGFAQSTYGQMQRTSLPMSMPQQHPSAGQPPVYVGQR